ncbi:type 4a pilus biogenesis protein PilO [Candidatus Nomurabacteria bacterium]|nr:type 4a pilus biogenesis protein PilO [Candidatus Nomurabacteria bacterium]
MKKYTPIILIIIAIALFFLFIDPQYKQIKDLQNSKADNDTLLGLSQDLQSKRDKLHASFNSISASEKEQLQKLLPNTVDNVRLILDINNIAETYGITIRNIAVSGGQEEEKPDSKKVQPELSNEIGIITLSFSMTSTYDVFLEFLKDLEEALRVVDVEKLTIDGDNGQFMNFGVTLNTYWLR